MDDADKLGRHGAELKDDPGMVHLRFRYFCHAALCDPLGRFGGTDALANPPRSLRMTAELSKSKQIAPFFEMP